MTDKPKGDPPAFERFEEFTRRLLRVPKKAIDRRLAEERAARTVNKERREAGETKKK